MLVIIEFNNVFWLMISNIYCIINIMIVMLNISRFINSVVCIVVGDGFVFVEVGMGVWLIWLVSFYCGILV